MSTNTHTNKNATTAAVCRYVQQTKKLSIRGISRLLGIHHRTWQRYLSGMSRPEVAVRHRMVILMEVKNFEELVKSAMRHHVGNLIRDAYG